MVANAMYDTRQDVDSYHCIEVMAPGRRRRRRRIGEEKARIVEQRFQKGVNFVRGLWRNRVACGRPRSAASLSKSVSKSERRGRNLRMQNKKQSQLEISA